MSSNYNAEEQNKYIKLKNPYYAGLVDLLAGSLGKFVEITRFFWHFFMRYTITTTV